jgi:hypothetical protein
MAGCRLMWPDVCRHWLPLWLPIPLAPLTFSALAAHSGRMPDTRPDQGGRRGQVDADRRSGPRGPSSSLAGHRLNDHADDAPQADRGADRPRARAQLAARALAGVMTAATGIGYGAATPAPHPASSPVGTDSGILTPSDSPGSRSRTATTLPKRPRPRRRATRPAAPTLGPPPSRPRLLHAGPQASAHPLQTGGWQDH